MNRLASQQADRLHALQEELRRHEGGLSSPAGQCGAEMRSPHDLIHDQIEELRAGADTLSRQIDSIQRHMHEQRGILRSQAELLDRQAGQLAACQSGVGALWGRVRRGGGPDPSLARKVAELGGKVPLSWVRSTRSVPFSNFGDALSPLVVSVMSGAPVAHCAFDSAARRLAAVGTIGQGQSAGSVHFWGTGFDPKRNATGDGRKVFAAAPGVEYIVHAVRGPFTRRALLAAGIDAPAIFGDPAWFLPRILHPKVEKTHELGVILHISELDTPSPKADSIAGQARFGAARDNGVRLISTYHDPSWRGFVGKLEEILSCRRIVSNSFHGLLLADAYQIPCLYFPNNFLGPKRLELEGNYDDAVNHRFADFYRGIGRSALFAYGQPASEPTDWDKVMAAIDRCWEPSSFTGEALFDAFPLAAGVDFSAKSWPVSDEAAAALPW